MKSVALDCDADTVLVKVDQTGAACHTGDRTCFDADVLPPLTAPPYKVSRHGSRHVPQARRRPARHPVTRRLLADGDTPVGLYRKLAAERPGTFLLESAENGRTWSRYSFIGVRSAATLTSRDGEAHWLGTPPVGVPAGGDPLQALRATVETLHTPRDLVGDEGLPPFTGGMVGYLGYDVVRRWSGSPSTAATT